MNSSSSAPLSSLHSVVIAAHTCIVTRLSSTICNINVILFEEVEKILRQFLPRMVELSVLRKLTKRSTGQRGNCPMSNPQWQRSRPTSVLLQWARGRVRIDYSDYINCKAKYSTHTPPFQQSLLGPHRTLPPGDQFTQPPFQLILEASSHAAIDARKLFVRILPILFIGTPTHLWTRGVNEIGLPNGSKRNRILVLSIESPVF